MVEHLRKNLESNFYSSLQVLKIPLVVFFVFGAGKARMPFTPNRSIRSSSLEILCVMVQAQVGKEFPDMRQNEREIKFIRVGDAVRTVGQLKGEPTLNRESLVHFYTQGTRSGIGILRVIC